MSTVTSTNQESTRRAKKIRIASLHVASGGLRMARKGRRRKGGGNFKILNREQSEGPSGHKQISDSRNCATERRGKEKNTTEGEKRSLAIVLARSVCELCEEKGTLCVVTERRGVKSICRVCRKVNSQEKTRHLESQAREVEDVLRMAENKLAIPKTKPRKSARQEILGMAAQRREEQKDNLAERLGALEATQRQTEGDGKKTKQSGVHRKERPTRDHPAKPKHKENRTESGTGRVELREGSKNDSGYLDEEDKRKQNGDHGSGGEERGGDRGKSEQRNGDNDEDLGETGTESIGKGGGESRGRIERGGRNKINTE